MSKNYSTFAPVFQKPYRYDLKTNPERLSDGTERAASAEKGKPNNY